jgi:hypothetical protein
MILWCMYLSTQGLSLELINTIEGSHGLLQQKHVQDSYMGDKIALSNVIWYTTV